MAQDRDTGNREQSQRQQATEGARKNAGEDRGQSQKTVSKGENRTGGNIEQETQNDKKLRP